MKKLVALVVSILLMVAVFAGCAPAAPAESEAPEASESAGGAEASTEASEPAEAGKKLTIGYYKDGQDDYYKAGSDVFIELAKEAGWDVIDKTGQGTAPEQIAAVEDFITTGVDAIIVVQNSPEATSECIDKANAAKIPYFGLTHMPSVKEGQELAGFVGYDFVSSGVMAGEDALAKGVKKVVMIEGKLGQGTASAQTEGFIKAYVDAGKDVGDLWVDGKPNIDGTGGADLELVFKGSGEWFADPAKKAMQDAITSLGKDGFDGAYIQNDEMMDGGIQAFEEAGLNPGDYWLGSSNGKEKSWKWVEEGKETMDVNQTPTLEADLLFQMIQQYFDGSLAKPFVYSVLRPFSKDTMADVTLIPYALDTYMADRDTFSVDLGDASVTEITDKGLDGK